MEFIIRDVTMLDERHRRALEDVLGRELRANQRLVINVLDDEVPGGTGDQPPQTFADWTRLSDGLTSDQAKQFDEIVKTRANLTRNLP